MPFLIMISKLFFQNKYHNNGKRLLEIDLKKIYSELHVKNYIMDALLEISKMTSFPVKSKVIGR